MNRKNAWAAYSRERTRAAYDFAEEYKEFLNISKTERECVDTIVNEAEERGFVELARLIEDGKSLSAGDKVYAVWMNKSVILMKIGREPMEKGMNILGAHIDSPRLDVNGVKVRIQYFAVGADQRVITDADAVPGIDG